MYCRECGKEINDKAIICVNCGCSTADDNKTEKSKIVAILLSIFLGSFGIQRFYLNETGTGIAILLFSLLFCWTIFIPFFIWLGEVCNFSFISDEKFNEKYNSHMGKKLAL